MRLSLFVATTRQAAAFKVTPAAAAKSARAYLSRYWSDLPMPSFKMVKRMGVRWLGRTKWRSDSPDNTIIELNVHALPTQEKMDQVVAHELIHHWQFLKEDYGSLSGNLFKMLAHGSSFDKWAAKINSWKGPNYVTEKSNEMIGGEAPEFIVLIKQVSPGSYGWMWAKRPSAKQLSLIERFIEKGWRKATSKMYELTQGPRIGPRGTYVTTYEDAINEHLQTLWHDAKAAAA